MVYMQELLDRIDIVAEHKNITAKAIARIKRDILNHKDIPGLLLNVEVADLDKIASGIMVKLYTNPVTK